MRYPLLHWLLAGAAVGAAEVVPGFSGGTMAVLVRIYERLLAALARLHPAAIRRSWGGGGMAGTWRDLDGNFLAAVGGAMLFSIWLLSHPVSWLYRHYTAELLAFLLALVSLNLLVLAAQLRPTAANFGSGLVGCGAVLCLFAFADGVPAWELSWPGLLLAGAGGGLLMILPGVSGGYLLLVLGLYLPVLEAVGRLDFAVLLPLALGVLVGAGIGVQLVTQLLRRGGDAVRAGLYGMVAGSAVLLWSGTTVLNWTVPVAFVCGAACAGAMIFGARSLSVAVLLAALSLPPVSAVSAQAQDNSEDWPVYEISKGENLSMIAALYRVTPSDLVRWNNLASPSRIFPGKKLRMPPGTQSRTHQVKKNETLSEIALQNRTFLKRLQQLNGLSSPDLIYPGQVLRLAPALQLPEHRVRRGDTLLSLALRYNRSVEELARANKLQPPYTLKVGQVLRLSGPLPAVRPPPRSGKTPPGQPTAAERDRAERRLLRSEQSLRWQWPSEGTLAAHFHPNRYKGVDIVAAEGSAVRAAADGEVRYAGNGLFRDYGWLVILAHGRYLSIYAHNQRVLVKQGQKVKRGQRIARMGSSGSDSVKLHFQVKYRGRATDPLSLLPKRGG